MKNLGIRKLEITPEENEEIKRSKTEYTSPSRGRRVPVNIGTQTRPRQEV
jgi:hypothetical protein